MLRYRYEILALTNDADNFCVSQTPLSAGYMILDGVDASTGNIQAQKIQITCFGDETAATFTIVGTNENGQTQTENITGANATQAFSAKYYKTLSSVYIDVAAADALEVGAAAASGALSPTFYVNTSAAFYATAAFYSYSGTSSVEYTISDVMDTSITPVWFPLGAMTGLTGTTTAVAMYNPVCAIRFKVTSGDATSNGTLEYIQSY